MAWLKTLWQWSLRGAVALAILGLMGAGIAAFHLDAGAMRDAGGADAPLPVSVVTLEAEEAYTLGETFTGRLEPRRRTDVAFEIAGRVTDVTVEEGERVAAGAVLARLDTERLAIERRRLEADRRRVAADVNLAVNTLERQRTLQSQGHASTQRLDEARFAVSALSAERDAVDAAIAALDEDIAKSTLRAPYEAVVGARWIDEGTVVQPGAAVVELLESRAPLARIGMTPEAADRLRVGMRAELVSQGRRLAATLTAIRPDIETGTRTVTVLWALDAPLANGFGELVGLTIERAIPEPGFWVPIAALSEGLNGLWSVLAVADGPEGPVLVRESVEVLHTRGAEAYARGTVAPGMRIVAGGLERVIPGQRVDPVDALARAGARE